MGTRWTPLAVLIGVAAAVLAGAGVVAAVAHEDDRTVTEAVQGGASSTTTTEPPVTTSTTALVVPAPADTTTIAPAPTTARATTTTRPPRTTTTRATTPTTAGGTPPTSSPPVCAVGQIDVSVRPESDRYLAGQPVTAVSTIRNRSSSPCFYRGYNVTFTFRDPSLDVLVGSTVQADDIDFRQFAPGQSITHTATWDPSKCTTAPCPDPAPGIYSVAASWSFSGGRYGGTRQFVVT